MTLNLTDWYNRWLGGFCALGAAGGLPVRGPDYAAHPVLDRALTLPKSLAHAQSNDQPDAASAQAAWAAAMGGQPIVLVRNVARARALLLEAAGVGVGAAIGLPANATRALAEAVKRSGAFPAFLDLTPDLALPTRSSQLRSLAAVWAQPAGGLPLPISLYGVALWVDYADTLPIVDAGDWSIDREPAATTATPQAPDPAATLYGLHLSPDEKQAGAVLVFGDLDLARAVIERLEPADQPDPVLALAQLRRLGGPDGLVARQQSALAAVWRGLHEAAGLPMLPIPAVGGLAHGVLVQIPAACDTSTFYAYVRGENTPVRWLPEFRPLHYAAPRANGAPAAWVTAATIARWLLVPVGPDYTEEEVSHAILGVVKASDYLGVRWCTDPKRAAWYAELMVEWYGPDHDAYRPAFAPRFS